MIYCPESEIFFAQVREDPTIELQVIQRLSEQQKHPLRILIIASGGCTALSLLAHPHVAQIEAVDLNPAQLHLVELRRQALIHLSLESQLQLIGVDLSHNEQARSQLYKKLRSHLPQSTQSFWDERQAQITFGVNRVGRFEQLFRELALEFSQLGLEPLNQPEISVKHPQWREIFERVFERDKLAKIFGSAAVNYSMERSFGEHFADVFGKALQKFVPAENNYFITQVWGDRYASHPNGLPLYLQAPVQAAIRVLGADRLRLHLGAFAEKMPVLADGEKFDLIQFSNISDWMPLPELDQMLATAVNCLKPGGALIGRRLNGDLDLATAIAKHMVVDNQLSAKLLEIDRSFFYREIVIAFR